LGTFEELNDNKVGGVDPLVETAIASLGAAETRSNIIAAFCGTYRLCRLSPGTDSASENHQLSK
jgi:hypothetical protein